MVYGEEFYPDGVNRDSWYCEWIFSRLNDQSLSQEEREFYLQEAALCQV